MPMLGRCEDLMRVVDAASRLRRGLELLQDCLAGRAPEIVQQVQALAPGETRRMAVEAPAFQLILQCYKPRSRDEGRFEAHARHTDLQCLWSGRECIEVSDLRVAQPAAAYDDNGNTYFPMGQGTNTRLILEAGEVAVLSPGDAHAACLRVEGYKEELVRKLVLKVLDAHADYDGADETQAAAPEAAAAVAPAAPRDNLRID